MTLVEFPAHLKALLNDSIYTPHLRVLADRIDEVLRDNKLPFFPDYTDHGIAHINRVLHSQVSMVPAEVWNRNLLCDADAAVIIGATLLHDLAMHLRADGFLALIAPDTRFTPLRWFCENHSGHMADRPWCQLWQDYLREARRFSDKVLTNIVGPESLRRGWKFQSLPTFPAEWDRNHYLVVGEFIRRHHARLAHEIAVYGFPGVPSDWSDDGFPAIGQGNHPLTQLADLIGLTARSHGTSLRVCKAYLDSSAQYSGTPRPLGTAVLFPMALLRVADYLQIDRQRSPAVLLQLRNPQSPVSLLEWRKHLAVQRISPADDPRGKMVTVSESISLDLYLQLRELLAGLQHELDHCTAVLDETYGTRSDLGLNHLGLATRRIYSNLNSPVFQDNLPYVPEKTGFETDPNLLTLLVEPLYGNNPEVGVRELVQNSVDAVRELHAWCEGHGFPITSVNVRVQECDVLVDFVERADSKWVCRVTDRGIGMTSDTIRHYLLRAGASFRQSADWTSEFADDFGKPRVVRSGRFGIGVFSIFLLGGGFRLWSRHAAGREPGYFVHASADSQLIEVRRMQNLPVGTVVEVDLSDTTVDAFRLNSDMKLPEKGIFFSSPKTATDWYCWDWPVVTRRISRMTKKTELEQTYTARIGRTVHSPEWSVIHPQGFDAIYWSFGNFPSVVCNGLRVVRPKTSPPDARFYWPDSTQLGKPVISVVDSEANLPLTVQRYELTRERLPFIDELAKDVTLSYIAHALVCGPGESVSSHPCGPTRCQHPLVLDGVSHYHERTDKREFLLDGKLRWCSTSRELVPVDPWLFSLLRSHTYFLYGTLAHRSGAETLTQWPLSSTPLDSPTLCWDVISDKSAFGCSLSADFFSPILSALCLYGARALAHKVTGSRLIASIHGADFRPDLTDGLTVNPIVAPPESKDRVWYELTSGKLPLTSSIEDLLHSVEKRAAERLDEARRSRNNREHYEYDILFVSEVAVEPSDPLPTSLIANVWNDYLGPHAIPFDLGDRCALIDQGCRHPELRRHIEAWQEMNRNGSK